MLYDKCSVKVGSMWIWRLHDEVIFVKSDMLLHSHRKHGHKKFVPLFCYQLEWIRRTTVYFVFFCYSNGILLMFLVVERSDSFNLIFVLNVICNNKSRYAFPWIVCNRAIPRFLPRSNWNYAILSNLLFSKRSEEASWKGKNPETGEQ